MVNTGRAAVARKIFACAIAAGEMMIGIGLALRKTRVVAIWSALLMHSLLLLLLIGSRRNEVIWPWNLGMIIMVLLLFRRSEASWFQVNFRKRARGLAMYLPRAVFLLCGVLPAFSFAGWWDLYLSGALYAGNAPIGVMRMDGKMRNDLAPAAQEVIFNTSQGEAILPF